MSEGRNSSRLDVELVQRGLACSRAQAREAISAGQVRVNGQAARKAGLRVQAGDCLEFEKAHPWVSRGGVKLAHALDAFGVDPANAYCLDVGASTGGFTDVLLSRGARCVVAVDVGRGQLHEKLRRDERVVSLEETDARALTPGMIGVAPDVVVCDASFIGLAKVLPAPLKLAAEDAVLVALFKPQFEVGRENIGKGGIVAGDSGAVEASKANFETWLASQGWRICGWERAPIAGGDGNQEWLACARREPR